MDCAPPAGRYGTKANTEKKFRAFSEHYAATWAVPVLQGLLASLQTWVGGVYMPPKVLALHLKYLDAACGLGLGCAITGGAVAEEVACGAVPPLPFFFFFFFFFVILLVNFGLFYVFPARLSSKETWRVLKPLVPVRV